MWRKIEGFEDYEISEDGQVRNALTGRMRKICVNRRTGYEFITVCFPAGSPQWEQHKRKYLEIHREVARAYIPNPENKGYVDHIDRNIRNNHVSNLRWCTAKENQLNSDKTILVMQMRGTPYTSIGRDKAIEQLDQEGNLIKVHSSIKKAAAVMGISPCTISHVLSGRNKTAAGYKWRYHNV